MILLVRLLLADTEIHFFKEALVVMMKRLIVTLMVTVLVSAGAVPAMAAESQMKVVLEDAVYGGLIGTLLGAATWAFTDNKSDHVDNIGYGAALGVMAGTAIGVYTNVNRSFVEYENGKVKLALPTVKPEFQDNGRGQMVVAFKADILKGNF
jgi:uncharacterized membrane protein YebE (DUF533 family)